MLPARSVETRAAIHIQHTAVSLRGGLLQHGNVKVSRQDLVDGRGDRSAGQHRELCGVLEDRPLPAVDAGSDVATDRGPPGVDGVYVERGDIARDTGLLVRLHHLSAGRHVHSPPTLVVGPQTALGRRAPVLTRSVSTGRSGRQGRTTTQMSTGDSALHPSHSVNEPTHRLSQEYEYADIEYAGLPVKYSVFIT
jgi:hypothetical protein